MVTIEACVECVSVISSSVELGDQPRVQKVLLLARKHGVTCVTRVTNLSRGYIFVSCCCVTLDPAHWLTAALTLAGPKIPHDRQGPHWPGCEGYAPRNLVCSELRHSQLCSRCSLCAHCSGLVPSKALDVGWAEVGL